MNNDIVPRNDKPPINPFAAYGRAVRAKYLLGAKIGFNKGAFLVGEKRVLELGAQFTACLGELRVGYKKWRGGQLVDDATGLLAEGFQPPKRSDLDDNDGVNWEVQPDGTTRDPWVFTNELPMVALTDNEILTYVTSSKGGLGAIGALCAEFVIETGMYPVVELQCESYMHKIRSYGRIHVPLLPIVKYVPAKPYDDILAAARSGGSSPPATNAPALKPISDPDNDNEGESYPDGYGGRGPIGDDIPF